MDNKLWRGNIGLLILAYLGFSRDAVAEQWAITGNLGQQFQYNDNMNFSSTNRESVFGYQLTPILKAALNSKALELGFHGQGDIRRYDDSRWNCDSYSLELNGRYSTNRNTFSMSGGYSLGCTYSQQVSDTGVLVPTVQFENFRVAPTWTWRWTRRTRLIAEAGYSKTSYINANQGTPSATTSGSGNVLNTGFVGNDTYSARLGVSHDWSRRLSLNGGVYYSNIKYADASLPTQDVYGFQFGANYAINRRWQLSLGAGPRWTYFQAVPNDPGSRASTVLGNVANIGVNYKDRKNRASVGYSNSINPSAIGQVQQYHNIFLNYSRNLDKRVFIDTSISFQRSDAFGGQQTGEASGSFKRDFFNATAGISWEFAKDWRLRADYLYRWQQYKQTGESSDSNAVMVSVSYAWDGVRGSN